jgi:hypothetical protein
LVTVDEAAEVSRLGSQSTGARLSYGIAPTLRGGPRLTVAVQRQDNPRMARCESAATLAWLEQHLGEAARQAWTGVRSEMEKTPAGTVIETAHWVSDPWLARSSEPAAVVGLTPVWAPPQHLDDWPSHSAREIANEFGDWARTNHAAFERLTAGGGPAGPADGVSAAEAVDALRVAAEERVAITGWGSEPMIQYMHVVAWLDTAVGRPFRGLVLSPGVQADVRVREFFNRLTKPLRFDPGLWTNEFQERRLEELYNLEFAPDGSVILAGTRVGQGESWRESWVWLSTDLDAEGIADATRLAARAMRCSVVVAGLKGALQTDETYPREVALCVIRRWLLSLKAMAWLESALAASWRWVRPFDLACFAYNAVKPDFPRRTLAISHRSADVKPILVDMRIWGAARAAIDANYVPAWETNTGMVWGLFASTPAIARVRSVGYDESVWCRRELELTQYLLDKSDFMSERWVGDLKRERVRTLDDATTGWIGPDGLMTRVVAAAREFPPLCELWTVDPLPQWELLMLRAAALIRILNAFLRDPEVANEVAARLAAGKHFDPPAMTNHPGGWAAYGAIFHALSAELGVEAVPVRLRSDYDGADDDRERIERIPSLARGTPALDDVLVAYEWLRAEWPWMMRQENYTGDKLVIDFRGITAAAWENEESLSLLRGVASIHMPAPLWFIQSADQDVEGWPLIADRPIFTQHVESQFDWMISGSLKRDAAQASYPQNANLELSPVILRRCAAAAARAKGTSVVALRANPYLRRLGDQLGLQLDR